MTQKGITLPMNAVIAISLAVLVLFFVSSFFAVETDSRMTKAKAEQIFSTGCSQYCGADAKDPYTESFWMCPAAKAGLNVSQDRLDFCQACITLGYVTKKEAETSLSDCLVRCGQDVCSF